MGVAGGEGARGGGNCRGASEGRWGEDGDRQGWSRGEGIGGGKAGRRAAACELGFGAHATWSGDAHAVSGNAGQAAAPRASTARVCAVAAEGCEEGFDLAGSSWLHRPCASGCIPHPYMANAGRASYPDSGRVSLASPPPSLPRFPLPTSSTVTSTSSRRTCSRMAGTTSTATATAMPSTERAGLHADTAQGSGAAVRFLRCSQLWRERCVMEEGVR